jgi:hypothetical protein
MHDLPPHFRSHPGNLCGYRLHGGLINPYQVAAARRAIHRRTDPLRCMGGGFWPLDTLRDLRWYADRRHVSFEAAMASLTAGLITDLLHYAHRYGA